MNYMPPEAIKDLSSYGENGKSRSKVTIFFFSCSLHVKKKVVQAYIIIRLSFLKNFH